MNMSVALRTRAHSATPTLAPIARTAAGAVFTPTSNPTITPGFAPDDAD